MKLSQVALALALSVVLGACSTTMSQDGSLQQAQQHFEQYQALSKQYQINEQWWLGYQDPELNRLIELAFTHNINLAKSAIAVNRALYNANLLSANLVPSFTANGQSSASKSLDTRHSPSTIAHQASLNLSYTLDLWHRLADAASAAEWEYKATMEDLQAARLSLINAVINSYYQLAYYQQAVNVTERTIRNYQQISTILQNKLNVGSIDQLGADQANQAILAAKNNLANLQISKKTTEQTLRNLLNLKPDEQLSIHYPDLLKVKLQDVDMNVPVSVIANRPDLMASLQRLQSAFSSLTSMEKSWFPSITLGASLSANASKVSNLGDYPIAGGLVSFNLPFLDWNRVKNNVKISETSYQTAKLNYEQAVTFALNEIDTYYFAYNQARSSFNNLQKKYHYDKRISGYYKSRYEQGVSEFREWITALNTELNTELSILNAKFSLLRDENAVYQAMAGKYQK